MILFDKTMSMIALIVAGKVQNKDKLWIEVNTLLAQYKKSGLSPGLIVPEVSDNSCFFKNFDCEVYFVKPTIEDLVFVDMTYKVKHQIDLMDMLRCHFLTDSSSQHLFAEVCKMLFPPLYEVSWQVSESLESFSCFDIAKTRNIEEDVESYLHSIPSLDSKPVTFVHSKLIPAMFHHGYSSRQGGISNYKGLTSLSLCYSLKKRDSRAVVMENRARLANAAGFAPSLLHLAKAVHGRDVWIYEEKEPECYDAIITKTPNVFIAAPGADCNMMLFADPVTKSCGAAHAGWKGILCGVVQSTVNAMVDKYGVNPKDLIVAIGPSLSKCCCEFGPEQAKKFSYIDENCVIWKDSSSKPFLDLRLAAKVLLQSCGVLSRNIDDGEGTGSELLICTKCDPDERFFSFRRMGPQFGNQVGFIGMSN